MASANRRIETQDFRRKMAPFPCMFNMPCFDHQPRAMLRNRQTKLLIVLNQERAKEDNIKIRNSLTWLYYQLGLYELAREQNELVLMETKNDSLVALGNKIYMEWLNSGLVSDSFKDLEKLRVKQDFQDRVLEAKAEQALCIGKIGNQHNLITAIELYKEVLARKDHDTWRYHLGVAYRRLSVMSSIEKYSNNKLSADKCRSEAKECFRRVSASPDKRLRAKALMNVAANTDFGRSPNPEDVEDAIRTDESAEVCMLGGKALLSVDINRAVSLLEKAVNLRPEHTVSRHQLGKAYLRQVDLRQRWDDSRVRTIQDEAHEQLRLAYELSDKLNFFPLFDLSLSYENLRKQALMTILTLRATTAGNILASQVSAHFSLYQLSKSAQTQRHLFLSMLAAVALLNEEATDEERRTWWAQAFERGLAHHGVTLKKNSEQLLKNVRANTLEMGIVCQSISSCLQDGRIEDPEALSLEARNILRSNKKNQNEQALLFLEFASLRPGMDVSRIGDARRQLLATQAKLCLEEQFSISSLFFRQLFESRLSRRCEGEEGGPGDKLEPDLDSDLDFDASIKIDMLVLFNDSIENTSSRCEGTAYGLEDAISTLFQLKVAFNPNLDTGDDESTKDDDAGLVHFVKKHHIDVILIIFEGDGAETKCLLEKVKPFIGDRAESRRPSVVLIQTDDQEALNLPDELKRFPCLSLGKTGDQFPNLFCRKDAQEQADKSVYMREVIQAYFHGNNDNIVTLCDHLTRFSG